MASQSLGTLTYDLVARIGGFTSGLDKAEKAAAKRAKAIEETFDVGVDTRTPVDDKDYQVPFRFTGKLDKLTVKIGPVQLTSDEHQVIRHARAGANN